MLPSSRPFRAPEQPLGIQNLKLRVNVHNSVKGSPIKDHLPEWVSLPVCASERRYFRCELPLPREDSLASL